MHKAHCLMIGQDQVDAAGRERAGMVHGLESPRHRVTVWGSVQINPSTTGAKKMSK